MLGKPPAPGRRPSAFPDVCDRALVLMDAEAEPGFQQGGDRGHDAFPQCL
jgi:hypothetical protein